jgi:glycerol kinase
MGKESYILALDQGTTSSRAILFDREGRIFASRQEPFRQIFPRPGWVEHDPYDILNSQLGAARGVMEASGIGPEGVAGIGITNQRETLVVWDKATGKPVHNAIVWQCRRSASICQELKALGMEDFIREKTGLVLDPYFSGSKLMWLFNEIPGLRERAERGELLFGTIDSWLLWNLTGNHLTDATNASRTLFFNIREGRWDDEILKQLKIPRQVLPRVVPCAYDYGLTKKEIFGGEIPVTGCAGDQQAALFGHACFAPGSAKNTYGTGCFTLMNTGTAPVASKFGLLTTIAWDLGAGFTYALEGSVFIAGAVVQWLRDGLGLIESSEETERIAASVPDSGDVCFVPAFVGLGAPYWDPDVRASILGITRGTTKAHIVRAALEAIAYQSKDLIDAMESDLGKAIPFIKADGGASANSFLMQFQADILDKPVILPEAEETTALGAAYLAGIGLGYWSGIEDVERNWRKSREYLPRMDGAQRAARLERWRAAIAATREFK